MIECHSSTPIKIAEVFIKKRDYQTAGMWTAKAFEKFLNDACIRLIGFVPTAEKDRIYTLTKYICEKPKYKHYKNIFKNLRELRVKAIHFGEIFTERDANKFIKATQNLLHNK